MLESLNYLFNFLFTLEAGVKLLGIGKTYFKDKWNVFDFIIVTGTNLGLLMRISFGIDFGPQATVIRTFRIGRMFRLLKRNKSLN